MSYVTSTMEKIWKEFVDTNSRDTDEPRNVRENFICFMLKIDWFQPYKHTNCSVGVVYLVIVNLPRSIRFKRENVIIVGILPWPTEPKHDINPYLEPLVEELLTLWKGVTMKIN